MKVRTDLTRKTESGNVEILRELEIEVGALGEISLEEAQAVIANHIEAALVIKRMAKASWTDEQITERMARWEPGQKVERFHDVVSKLAKVFDKIESEAVREALITKLQKMTTKD